VNLAILYGSITAPHSCGAPRMVVYEVALRFAHLHTRLCAERRVMLLNVALW